MLLVGFAKSTARYFVREAYTLIKIKTDEQKENYNKITNVMDIVSQLYNTEEKFFVHYIT